jgi:hypothetical protein
VASTAANPTSSVSPTPSRAIACLDELNLGSDDDIGSGSIQPIVSINQDDERKLELMRWDLSCLIGFYLMRGPRVSRPRSSGRMLSSKAASSFPQARI